MHQQSNIDLDDLKLLTHCLRHYCEGYTKIKKALPVIVHKTGLSEERVIELLKRYFKDRQIE